MTDNLEISLILLVILFYLLGRAADVVILYLRQLGVQLRLKIFFLGIILGLATSLPELAVALNALINDIQEISVGNLLGGILVLFGLILGLSLVLNRKVETDGNIKHLLPILAFILLPLFLGFDGRLGRLEGLGIIVSYLTLLYILLRFNRDTKEAKPLGGAHRRIFQNLFLLILAVIFVLVISNLIVKIAQVALTALNISTFVLGMLVFSLGTNLPEIIISIRSWKNHIKELSISNLMGSAIANPLIIGLVAFLKPVQLDINGAYYLLMLFTLILFCTLLYTYKTDKSLTRSEGLVLIIIYFAFFAAQIFYLTL